jgi:hypothetical protein
MHFNHLICIGPVFVMVDLSQLLAIVLSESVDFLVATFHRVYFILTCRCLLDGDLQFP